MSSRLQWPLGKPQPLYLCSGCSPSLLLTAPRPSQVLSPSWYHLDCSRLHSLFPQTPTIWTDSHTATEYLLPCSLFSPRHISHLWDCVVTWLFALGPVLSPLSLILVQWVSESRCLIERFWLNDQRSAVLALIARSYHTTATREKSSGLIATLFSIDFFFFNTKNTTVLFNKMRATTKKL